MIRLAKAGGCGQPTRGDYGVMGKEGEKRLMVSVACRFSVAN